MAKEHAEYRLSSQAAKDIATIAEYTLDSFGIEQARHYRDGLDDCFRQLARHPFIGRSAEELAPGLWRHEHRQHVILYLPLKSGVLIVRVLHRNMDIWRHL